MQYSTVMIASWLPGVIKPEALLRFLEEYQIRHIVNCQDRSTSESQARDL